MKPPGKAVPGVPVGAPPVTAPVSKAKTKARASTTPKQYTASIFPPVPLSDKFASAVLGLEAVLKAPVWLIVQDAGRHGKPSNFDNIDEPILKAFLNQRSALPKKPINIIVESPGGQAKAAYQLATLFRQHCGGFNAYVPEWAKSAATLFVLGASNIYLAKYAELGPLDVQVFDAEREGMSSALDEVQSLERLNAFALQAVDGGMLFLKSRSGKSIGTLLPHMLHFVSEMLCPLFEKLDTVHYTQMSRYLKIGEEYAIRLLEPRYGKQNAEAIARQLVNGYPEHGFYIDRHEATRIGIKMPPLPDDLATALDRVRDAMHGIVAIGQLKVSTP
jgi:hypothetical protein